jgi:hypothetical protein
VDNENVTHTHTHTHTHTYTEFYSFIKKTEIMSLIGKWMKLELMLSEISQSHKDKYRMFSLICGS